MSNFSVPSTILSHVTGMLTILLTSPAANVTLIGLESKSTPDPVTVQKSHSYYVNC